MKKYLLQTPQQPNALRHSRQLLVVLLFLSTSLCLQVQGQKIYFQISNTSGHYLYDLSTNVGTTAPLNYLRSGTATTNLLYRADLQSFHALAYYSAADFYETSYHNNVLNTWNGGTSIYQFPATSGSRYGALIHGTDMFLMNNVAGGHVMLKISPSGPPNNAYLASAATTYHTFGILNTPGFTNPAASDGTNIYILCDGGAVANTIVMYKTNGAGAVTQAGAIYTASGNAALGYMCYGGNNTLYFLAGGSATTRHLYSFNTVTNTYTDLGLLPAAINTNSSARNLVSDGTYLYTNKSGVPGVAGIERYEIATNTWLPTILASPAGSYTPVILIPNSALSATVAATNVSCSGALANSDGTITVTTHTGGTKVGYSTGSGYSGPTFALATTLTAAPFTVTNTLSNPIVSQPYTVRIFKDASTYKDYTVALEPKYCANADISVSVSPTTATGNKGEYRTYTVTVTNAGPDAAPNVSLKSLIPSNSSLLTAVPNQGTYTEASAIWNVGTLAVGSKTLQITVKVN